MSADLPPEWPREWVPPDLTVADVTRILRDEASRIIGTQKRLIASGQRQRPDEGQLRKALAFHRVETFFVGCTPYLRQVRQLIESLKQRGPRG